jgi:hypothetical protein
MGMYTEIYVNVDLKKETPYEVICVLKAICEKDFKPKHLNDYPDRWGALFCSGSYYTPNTSCANLTFDNISGQYSLLGKGDIKNYDGEIEAFFTFIKPWCEEGFIGYYRYEENREPTLV